jgi:anaerobic magnesium-protoporphyrin IX monomethyl ester cyclase
MNIALEPSGRKILAPDQRKARVLIVDLNNLCTYPTLSIGLLTASLRNAGYAVEVLSPLAHDVVVAPREHTDTWKDHLARRIQLSTSPSFRLSCEILRATRAAWRNRPNPKVLEVTRQALATRPDVVLLSAYLQHYASVVAIGELAQQAGIPVLLGGPVFNNHEITETWRQVPGVQAIVGGEADLSLPRLVAAALDGADLLSFPGVTLPDGRRSKAAPPLRPLEEAPVPAFTDFPWERYRVRVVPVMAARGCQWDRCKFCSDVTSVSGRSFRTRSVGAVMAELGEQSRRHDARNFIFIDLKLNSQPALLRGIVAQMQSVVPGARWIGSVHVDTRKDNGLSRPELAAAVTAGLRRVSFGLESGSQRLLDAMDKGCTIERNSEFLHHAHEVGLSVRCTMFKGYPGETAEDLEATADFLEKHVGLIDRIQFTGFTIMTGTPIYDQLNRSPGDFAEMRDLRHEHRFARTHYWNKAGESRAYRRAKARVLRAVYDVNRQPLRSSAREFDGLM